ncbi:MAG: dihydrofolate reductase [Treponema sp.]|nr:dihydrofolate reductase [Treponema sp.]
MNGTEIALIAAFAKNNRVIGNKSKIPWNIPEDLHRFKELTMGNAAIFGRKTFESIGKALPGRCCIVLSKDPDYCPNDAKKADSLKEAVTIAESAGFNKIFICGGQSVYEEGIKYADLIYATEVSGNFNGDRFFPKIDSSIFFDAEHEKHDGEIPFEYILYRRNSKLY